MTYLPFPPQDEEQFWASQAAYTGTGARALQAIPTLGLFEGGHWLLLWAMWLRPEFHFLMTAHL